MASAKPASLERYRKKRNFRATTEPRGATGRASKKDLRLIIQKHDASHLHFDLRLELDGVMKSWAVPKGPSNDPSVKRLAMQVEDHPVEYNKFEGTIPKGEYGGGTVMLWDRGTYEPIDGGIDELRREFSKGSVKFVAHGERMKGEWALVRMNRGDGRQWLLIKHRDKYARAGGNLAARATRSVATGRTMREIAAEGASDSDDDMRDDVTGIEPMLAHVGHEVPEGKAWAFEPKYDGIRIIAYAAGSAVKLLTRNDIDKAAQFPEIVAALSALSRRKKSPLVLDGEIVARQAKSLARFQTLQERIHERDSSVIAKRVKDVPAAFIVFDLLLDRKKSYVTQPYSVRRRALRSLFSGTRASALQLGKSKTGDGAELLAEARKAGWEGIMAKRVDSTYQSGARSHDWLKLKLEARQEFVVGGWTEPRGSREHMGALLLGYWKGGKFVYAGHTGGGFTRQSLKEMSARLTPLEIAKSPFEKLPRTNAKPHWTKPKVVVEVKFNEWTEDGSLRQPVLLGVRDDKAPRSVTREAESVQRKRRSIRPSARKPIAATRAAPKRGIVAQLQAIEDAAGNGTLTFPGGATLDVTNLGKKYFPKQKYTKGDVMRYYASVADTILPLIEDRPLVLKRYPDGVDAPPFYQQNAPHDLPSGVRTASVGSDKGKSTPRDRRRSADAAVHRAARRNRRAPVALTREEPRIRGLCGARSRSHAGGAVLARHDDREIHARCARGRALSRRDQNVRLTRTAHLHRAAGAHDVSGGAGVRARHCDDCRRGLSERGDSPAFDRQASARHGVHRLSAERGREERRRGVQRARTRRRAGFDADRREGTHERASHRGFHHRERGGAGSEARQTLGERPALSVGRLQK